MSIEWHAFERFSSSRIQENFQLGGEFGRSLHTSYSCVKVAEHSFAGGQR